MCEVKICSKVPGHMTIPYPYIVKNLENLLLRNQEADDLETRYTASGTPNEDPGLTLTIFMTVSKFPKLLHR